MALIDKLKKIGDKIRDITKTSDLVKLDEMPIKIDEIYKLGTSDEALKERLDEAYNNGSSYGINAVINGSKCKGSCMSLFGSNSTLTVAPFFDTSNVTDCSNMFGECRQLIEVPNYDFSNANNVWDLFGYCTSLSKLGKLSFPKATSSGRIFYQCKSLKTIEELDFSSFEEFNQIFDYCGDLENIKIKGTIKTPVFHIYHSIKLTHDSLMSIINALEDNSGNTTAKELQIGSQNIQKLSAEDIAIIVNKNWSYY